MPTVTLYRLSGMAVMLGMTVAGLDGGAGGWAHACASNRYCRKLSAQ
jgi:hypothetical protein